VNGAQIQVKFWGVRGSIACSGEATRRYGGNTSCLEVTCGGRRVILDGGTGLRYLGTTLIGQVQDCDLLLSHTHYDHIAGIPFFAPFFDPRNRFRLWAGHLAPESSLRETMERFMHAPLFPVPPAIFRATMEYRDFPVGERLRLAPRLEVVTGKLNHPNRATGYRLEYGGKAVAYITDTEHKPGQPDAEVLRLIDRADIAVYDAMFDDATLGPKTGFGHSTWQEALRLAELAKVKTLAIFHHDPESDDARLDAIAAEAARMRPGTIVAKEGMVLIP